MSIKPGIYVGKIVKYGIGTTKNGDPQAVIQFQFLADGNPHQLTWFGSFKEKAKPYTIDALLRCGLKGANVIAVADGPDGGALDMEKELSLDVRVERDEKGNERAKIAWINEVGGAAFKNLLSKSEASNALAGLEADVMDRRAQTGIGAKANDFGKEDDFNF